MIHSLLISGFFHSVILFGLLLMSSKPLSLISQLAQSTPMRASISTKVVNHLPTKATTPAATKKTSPKPSKAENTVAKEPVYALSQSELESMIDEELMQEQKVIEHAYENSRDFQVQAEHYKQALESSIGRLWNVPLSAEPDQICEYQIHLSPSGHIIELKRIETSGNEALDRSVEQAILKASPLPLPKDPKWYAAFKVQRLRFDPKQLSAYQTP